MSKIFSAQTKRQNIKYKYIVDVPQNIKEYINFDQ